MLIRIKDDCVVMLIRLYSIMSENVTEFPKVFRFKDVVVDSLKSKFVGLAIEHFPLQFIFSVLLLSFPGL